MVFWVVTPSSLVGGYQLFGGKYHFHLQGLKHVRRRIIWAVKARCEEGSQTHRSQCVPPKCQYACTRFHGVTTQTTTIWTTRATLKTTLPTVLLLRVYSLPR
jgi:hypothetical protein